MEGRSEKVMADEATNERLGSDFDRGYKTEALEFTTIEYTTMRAEYTWKDGNLIFHFFLPGPSGGMRLLDEKGYWKDTFPNCLSEEAEEYFDCSFPRLKAAYTEELKSWWMKAENFDTMDQKQFAERFLDKLDKRLEKELG